MTGALDGASVIERHANCRIDAVISPSPGACEVANNRGESRYQLLNESGQEYYYGSGRVTLRRPQLNPHLFECATQQAVDGKSILHP